ncbi:MAG: potassium transporter TrkG [Lachnospiraceae bacterium]|nr:potassium transporter TrkG [Lachnospiraceae bacterium]MDY5742802.1 potassium transporter TrkG [Lachnospiraceae bacterium]
MKKWINIEDWSTTRKITFSFLLVILVGSVLLSLPWMHRSGAQTQYLDHLFTAVSMVCVTGLSVLNVKEVYSFAGQLVSIGLMQIGGLGLITLISISFYHLKKSLSLKDQYTLQEALNYPSSREIRHFLSMVYRFTFIIEGIGMLLLMFEFVPRFGWVDGIWTSIFTAVSAFCNAGFDNLGDSSLQAYVTNPLVSLTVPALIICGGLGFSVWKDLRDSMRRFLHDRPRRLKRIWSHLSYHSRLVLMMTFGLLIGGMCITWLIELHNPATIGKLSLPQQGITSFFQSATMRTAGFATIDYTKTMPATNFIYMILMFIGGAPGGTAGGVKVTTIAIAILLCIAEIKGSEQVGFGYRSFPRALVKQAVTLLLVFAVVFLTGFALLLLTQPHLSFEELIFEAISAMATVGVSMNLTAKLNVAGEIIIMMLMFIGRVGPLTFFLSMMQRERREIKYAETNILIG